MEHHHHTTNKRILIISFILTTLFATLEITYGIIVGALSLLSEGIHMASDGLSLFIAALAVWLATKKATKRKTFGYRRAEPIAALLNGLGLMMIPIIVIVEAIKRLIFGGHEILSKEMLIVAVIGLIVNLVVAFVLMKGEKDNINVRAALLHIVADLLSSVSTIVVSLLIMFFDYVFIDAIASFIVSLIIFSGGFKITKEALNVLMEGAPEHIRIDVLTNEIGSINGVDAVEDIKVWSIAHEDDYMNIKISLEKEANIKDIIEVIRHIGEKNNLNTSIQIS